MRTPPFVLVEWDDAWSEKKGVHEEDTHYDQSYPVMAGGFLQHEGDDRVVVCRAWSPGHSDEKPHFSDCISIPRSLVRRIRRVRSWQAHQLPVSRTEKPVRRRRRKKTPSAPPPAETPAPAPAEEEPKDE